MISLRRKSNLWGSFFASVLAGREVCCFLHSKIPLKTTGRIYTRRKVFWNVSCYSNAFYHITFIAPYLQVPWVKLKHLAPKDTLGFFNIIGDNAIL